MDFPYGLGSAMNSTREDANALSNRFTSGKAE